MPLAHQRADDDTVRSGTIVLADEQLAGRGRQSRRWETPPRQALLLSIIFQQPLPWALHEIPMAAALAAVQAVSSCWSTLSAEVGLKWPNDLLLGQNMASAGKFGGILVENSFYGTEISHVVVGMGINVLQSATMLPPAQPGAPPPTSLRHYLATNKQQVSCDRTDLLIALCLAWSALVAPSQESPTLQQRWRAKLWTLGQQVTVHAGVGQPGSQNVLLMGEAVDVTPEGHLLVRDADGTLQRCTAGDVSIRMAPP
ncbi:MAG: biotin--[acetyl-CoA-carboxylase] ligase [Caldilineaceae bacterium]|nr:biotin--[acetyl-CoA-carboxylase] ligase [Caldilineaceae bacterium]